MAIFGYWYFVDNFSPLHLLHFPFSIFHFSIPSVFRVLVADRLHMDGGRDLVLLLDHLLDAGGDGTAKSGQKKHRTR